MDPFSVEVLSNLQSKYQEATGTSNLHFCLYDNRTEKEGRLRAVYPHSVQEGHIEPACGTGSVALAMALLMTDEGQRLGLSDGKSINVTLETGGKPVLGGPDETTVVISIEEDSRIKATFSHSLVEITSQGVVFV
jgi:diaminopimelate epimerase